MSVSLKVTLSIDRMTERNLLKEPEQLVEGNTDVDSNDDLVQSILENKQDLQENTRKRQLSSSSMKISPRKNSIQQKTTTDYRN